MTIEAQQHPYSTFLTLTYKPEALPVGGTLQKKHLQLFLKRLRAEVEPRLIRYYAVGEYGSRTWRPHYHIILFNISPTEEKLLATCWPHGHIHVGTVEPKSIAYTTGYMMKTLTKKTDRRLQGKHPEFACMSLRPAIGSAIVKQICTAYQTEPGQAALVTHKWVAGHMKVEGFNYPLGRYITNKVIEGLGLEHERIPHNNEVMRRTYFRKKEQTTTEYEQQRKAKIQQQRGKYKRPERAL